MWMKVILLIFLSMGLSSVVYADYPWLQDETLKVTIVTDDILYEWEYENPDQFEYEEGNTIYRGDKAKKSFEEILQYIDLSEPELKERLIQQLSDRYAGLNRITVKKKDMNQCLQTWLWDKKQI
ncbi:hypothetical protein CR203_12840 [Salipaludibacillus neizhouensis]|uniref:Uncharacterized protein n=1 Tax=Salipaludibacillus neizhouensis TaxID=885475 RepID=A0A3A9K8L7_9BACI|nr:hypothetical protein [Salipaludibacillus neizhouensis]RKL66721.1 hypothetical protein CR203_12840 [Salipaludibacillus neizhouensis]